MGSLTALGAVVLEPDELHERYLRMLHGRVIGPRRLELEVVQARDVGVGEARAALCEVPRRHVVVGSSWGRWFSDFASTVPRTLEVPPYPI